MHNIHWVVRCLCSSFAILEGCNIYVQLLKISKDWLKEIVFEFINLKTKKLCMYLLIYLFEINLLEDEQKVSYLELKVLSIDGLLECILQPYSKVYVYDNFSSLVSLVI